MRPAPFFGQFTVTNVRFMTIQKRRAFQNINIRYKEFTLPSGVSLPKMKRFLSLVVILKPSLFLLISRGAINQQTKWWVPAALKADINLNEDLSFSVKHGDYMALAGSASSVAFGIFLLPAIFFRKK